MSNMEHGILNSKSKLAQKRLDPVRGQGVIRRKNGAYTFVREYFAPDYNTTLGQQTIVFWPVLDFIEQINVPLQHLAHNTANRQVGGHTVDGCHAAVCIWLVSNRVDRGI